MWDFFASHPKAATTVSSPTLVPGSTFTVQFPELPPTFYNLAQKKDVKPQMTVFLPTNYDPARKHPLLLFLNGGDGGTGSNPAVARALSAEKDFVCVSVPLFKVTDPKAPGGDFIMRNLDGRYMWPFFRTMLAKLEELVPNIDSAHRVLGGFSNPRVGHIELIAASNSLELRGGGVKVNYRDEAGVGNDPAMGNPAPRYLIVRIRLIMCGDKSDYQPS